MFLGGKDLGGLGKGGYADYIQNIQTKVTILDKVDDRLLIDGVRIISQNIIRDQTNIAGTINVNDYCAPLFLEYADRIAAFCGDMTGRSLDILNDTVKFSTGVQLLTKDRKNILDLISMSIISSALHHASMANELYKFYDFLTAANHERFFLASATPIVVSSKIPQISYEFANKINSCNFGTTIKHVLTLPPPPYGIETINRTKAPIFSTYDSYGGFLKVAIKEDGEILIKDCSVLKGWKRLIETAYRYYDRGTLEDHPLVLRIFRTVTSATIKNLVAKFLQGKKFSKEFAGFIISSINNKKQG